MHYRNKYCFFSFFFFLVSDKKKVVQAKFLWKYFVHGSKIIFLENVRFFVYHAWNLSWMQVSVNIIAVCMRRLLYLLYIIREWNMVHFASWVIAVIATFNHVDMLFPYIFEWKCTFLHPWNRMIDRLTLNQITCVVQNIRKQSAAVKLLKLVLFSVGTFGKTH